MKRTRYKIYVNGYFSGVVLGDDCKIDKVEEFTGIARGTLEFDEFTIYDDQGQMIYYMTLCNEVNVSKREEETVEVYIER